MSSSVKNELRVKTFKAKKKSAKYKLSYKKITGTTNNNGDLSYSNSKSVSLRYKV